MDVIGSSYAGWSMLLVLGVPFCIILLNEYSERLKRRSSVYLPALEFARDVVLPFMVLVIVLRLVFSVSDDNMPTKIISTLFWVILIVALFRFSRAFLGKGEYKTTDWRSRVPALFLRLPTYTAAGLIVFHIIQNLWALPVTEMATTLGIGSVAIALALQDTLSNLVSGLLLVANSPFKTGDWIRVGEVEGKVLTVNSRYTHIETWNGDLVVIPNGSISGDSIENFSRPTRNTIVSSQFEISFNHPPNLVKRVLTETMNKTPGILSEPAPVVALVKIANPACEYCAEFWIGDHQDRPDILEDFLTRFWYAMRRENLSVPMQSIENFNPEERESFSAEPAPSITVASILDGMSNFARLSTEHSQTICHHATLQNYAATERILDEGEAEDGVFILAGGEVELLRTDFYGSSQLLEKLKPGAIFGETGLFQRAFSAISVVALTDCQVVIVPHAIFNKILDADPRLSSEVNSLVNRRRAAIKSADAAEQQVRAENTQVDSGENQLTNRQVQHVD